MPMDGFTLAAVTREINETLSDGRVDKITQPEADEIILAVRGHGVNRRLLLTANANAPRVHYTAHSKISPLQAPAFTMVLRKHLSGGRLLRACQPDFERIVELHISSRDEMGDKSVKRLIIEIMGKHSNIILTDESGMILGAAKHIPHSVSSVREVLPGRAYARPKSDKADPLAAGADAFAQLLAREDRQTAPVQQVLYQGYNGISPVTAGEICLRAGLSPETPASALAAADRDRLYAALQALLAEAPAPRVYSDGAGKAADFAVFPMAVYEGYTADARATVSETLEAFYRGRDDNYRLAQKTADLRKLVHGHMERCRRKQQAHEKTLREVAGRDRLQRYGELITAYIYAIEKGADSFAAPDYTRENAAVDIPLDPALTAAENAQVYFKQYNKQKRAYAALQPQMRQNEEELVYLDSVSAALQSPLDETDIAEIRAELAEQGLIKAKYKKQASRAQKKSKPLRFTAADGFEIYVGKNNSQNDELTLRFAQGGDIWLHTKDIAGSHVIIRADGQDVPESTLREAANLAAYYSKGRGSGQVPVDYTRKKHVRKPGGAKPGFVIYDHHKTLYVTPTPPDTAPSAP